MYVVCSKFSDVASLRAVFEVHGEVLELKELIQSYRSDVQALRAAQSQSSTASDPPSERPTPASRMSPSRRSPPHS